MTSNSSSSVPYPPETKMITQDSTDHLGNIRVKCRSEYIDVRWREKEKDGTW